MQELDIAPRYNLNIALTTDEEMGPYQAYHLADLGKLKLIISEHGWGQAMILTIASTGMLTANRYFREIIHTRSSFMGVNAIERSIPVMNELMLLKEKVEIRRSKVRQVWQLAKDRDKTLMPVLISTDECRSETNIVPTGAL